MESSSEFNAERDRLIKLAQAYVALFGEVGKPTPLGELVLDDLEAFTAFRRESLTVCADGRVDPYASIYRSGKQAVMQRIYARITWRSPDVNDPTERRRPADPTAPS